MPAAAGAVPRAIDDQVAPPHDRRAIRVARRPRARMRATSSAKANGLPQVVIRAQFQPVDPVLDVGGRGEHQDAARRAVAHQPAADPVTVHGRQVAVEHDHVVGRLLAVLSRAAAPS